MLSAEKFALGPGSTTKEDGYDCTDVFTYRDCRSFCNGRIGLVGDFWAFFPVRCLGYLGYGGLSAVPHLQQQIDDPRVRRVARHESWSEDYAHLGYTEMLESEVLEIHSVAGLG